MGSRPDTPRLNSFWNELSQRKGSALLAGAWLLATAVASAEPKTQARATFAGGCFWSVEAAFDKVKGVLSTTSGFAGGNERNPTYEQVASGRTGHAEVVQVMFDPAKVPYAKLVEAFCYPGSDDVTITPLDERWVLCYHHWEAFSFAARPSEPPR